MTPTSQSDLEGMRIILYFVRRTSLEAMKNLRPGQAALSSVS